MPSGEFDFKTGKIVPCDVVAELKEDLPVEVLGVCKEILAELKDNKHRGLTPRFYMNFDKAVSGLEEMVK